MEKYCRNCGNKMSEVDRFCPNCGTDSQVEAAPVQNNNVQQNYNAQPNNNVQQNYNAQPNYNGQVAPKKTNGLAVASFVCSMVGIVIFGIVMGILAICFGAAGLNRAKTFPQEGGRGLAIAGIVVGIIEVIIMIMYFSLYNRYSLF